ncbi:MAG: response regulator [Acidobacteria bacterium]|nr:MAG: response regulator [Acidobacteriota bacterium]
MATILVIDDSMFQRHAVAKTLKEDGYQVIEADNGQTGLERIDNDKPDAVILDLIMPRCSGFETLEILNKRGNTVPVFVFTADIQHSSRQRCLELGATAFLNKPLNKDELRGVLNDHLTQGDPNGGHSLPD